MHLALGFLPPYFTIEVANRFDQSMSNHSVNKNSFRDLHHVKSDACRHATDTCVPYAHEFQSGPGFRAEPCFCHSEKMAHGFPGMSPQSVICPNKTARPKQPHVNKYSQQLHVCNATKREEPSEHVPVCALQMSQAMQKLSSPTTRAMPSDRFRDSSLRAL